MSDILEKMVSVEKEASALVAEAEAEAERRRSQTRHEGESVLTAALAASAREGAELASSESKTLHAERDRRVAAYRASLSARPLDRDSFRRAALSLIGAK
jgi:hypothetical protein